MIIIQFTGLSGSGKSTLANALAEKLKKANYKVEILDGDKYREGLCKDLGYSKEDRCENIRRLGFVASRFAELDVVPIIAAINPYEIARREIKEQYKDVYTVWINCDIEELKRRDTKDLYKRALLPDNHPKKITNLTGVNDPYDIPENPDLVINTSIDTLKESIEKLSSFIFTCIENTSIPVPLAPASE
jgi:adenylylsulfate kinase